MNDKMGVVFVNFRCADGVNDRARRLIESGFEVVVVDNSGDYSGAGEVVRPGMNVGFGEGCNIGVRTFDGDVSLICLHNPDVDADPAVLRELGQRLLGLPRPGMVAPALSCGSELRRMGYHRPSLAREVILTCRESRGPRPLPSEGGDLSIVREVAAGERVLEAPRRFGSGALLVVHLDAFTSVGGFDDRYPLYVEDLDLWHRVAGCGHNVGFAPDLVISHARAAGSPTARPTRTLLRWVGVELFAALHQRSWPMMRRAHRRGLEHLDVAESQVMDAVRSSWAAGLDPLNTAAAVRAAFEAGAMDASVSA